jgi:Dockerin type I domain/CARDB
MELNIDKIRGFNGKRSLLVVTMISLSVISMLLCQSYKIIEVASASSSVNLPPMNLTLVAPNGTQKVIHEGDIGNLTSYRAEGGYKNKLGTITGPDNYTGVPLTTLCDLVGGINQNGLLLITASDGYTTTFTYAQVNGDFVTYDPITGNPVTHNQSIVPILAYFKNDVNVSSSDGPLRIAIVGPEGLITGSSYWSKLVVKLEVRWDDVAVSGVAPEKTVVKQGETCSISVTVENLGGSSETFNVTLYANTTVIGSMTGVTLSSGVSQIISFVWNTTGFVYAHYSITAKASTVKYETNTANNVGTGDTVTVTIAGDVNGDFKVDVLDLTAMAGIYGSHLGDSLFNANSDLNGDGAISILDLVTCSSHYGEKTP